MRPELEALLRPLTHYSDFRGRARPTELVGIWVLAMSTVLLSELTIALLGLSIFANYQAVHAIELLFFAPILWPMIATFVRRLHDQGRSGWWLLIGVPALAAVMVKNWRQLTLGWDSLSVDDPLALTLVPLASALAVIVLLLLPAEPGLNRYGPNPRDPEPMEAH